jgi:hypothetical protein
LKLEPRRSRLAVRLLAYLALGFVASIGVAWGLSATMDVMLGRMQTSDSYSAATDSRWGVTRWSRAGGMLAVSTRAADRAWGSRQAAGPPDTAGFGDIVTAWASSTTDGQIEWLELTYDRAVVPAAVHVHETYNPGAVFRVTVFDDAGQEVEAWRGQDPLFVPRTGQPLPGGVAKIPLKAGFPTRRVKVYIDSPKVPSWNEIDAVGLVDAAGGVQWATSVRASTVYGTSGADTTTAPAPADLVPRWGGLGTPSGDFLTNKTKNDTRAVVAYGWPMLAFWDERDAGVTQSQAAAMMSTAKSGSLQLRGGAVTVDELEPTSLLPALMGTPAPTPPALTPAPPAPAPATPVRTRMPMRPIWSGLAVNTLVFAGAIAALHWLAVWPLRLARDVSRVRSGRCIECGYDLGYDYLHGCPECGWRRPGNGHTETAVTLPPGAVTSTVQPHG